MEEKMKNIKKAEALRLTEKSIICPVRWSAKRWCRITR